MKNTMRLVAAILAVLLLCSLAACKEKQADAADNWVFASVSAGGTNTLTDQAYYYCTLSDKLMLADIKTGTSVVLCAKAGCQHKSEECEARMPMMANMFFWNEHLYYFQTNTQDSFLYRRNATGTGMETVCPIAEKHIDGKKVVQIERFAVAGKYLYFVAMVGDIVEDDYGVQSVQDILHYIGRIDLETGKEETVLEVKIEKQYESLILYGACSDGVVFGHMEGIDVEYGDPGFYDAVKQMQISLKRWDGKTGEVTTLFQENSEKCPGVQMIDKGKMFLTVPGDAGVDTFVYDLNTKKQTFAFKSSAWYWGGGYALRLDESNNTWYLYDLNDGKLLPYELADQCVFVQQTSDKGVVVWQSDCGEDGSEIWFYYIAYESLADGLQKTDMLYLFANKQGVF